MQKIRSADLGNPITFRDASKFYKRASVFSDSSPSKPKNSFKSLLSVTRLLVEKSVSPALAQLKFDGNKRAISVTVEDISTICESIAVTILEQDNQASLVQIINSLYEYKKGDGRFSLKRQTGASVVAHFVAKSQFTANIQDAVAINIYSEVFSALSNLATEQILAEASKE